MMETKNKFLGKGWSFPPTFNTIRNTIEMVEDEQDIKESLKILLSTTPGERVQNSSYGCNLSYLMFENVTTTLLTKMKGLIEDAIAIHEPRIEVEDIFFDTQQLEAGEIFIQVEYRTRRTNSRFNFVFPYYIKEGTHVNV